VRALRCDPLTISCVARHIANRGPSIDLSSYSHSLSSDSWLSINDVSNCAKFEGGLESSAKLGSEIPFEILEVSTMLAPYAIPVELFLGAFVHKNQISRKEKISKINPTRLHFKVLIFS